MLENLNPTNPPSPSPADQTAMPSPSLTLSSPLSKELTLFKYLAQRFAFNFVSAGNLF
jgi:hypothetical protein